MSDNIPFELQVEIFTRLPVKSLIQIRSVSKAWKSVIDSPDFIKNYGGKQQHLLARYNKTVDPQGTFVLIADDHTFPRTRVSLDTHQLVSMLKRPYLVGTSRGLLCFFGDRQLVGDGPFYATGRAVIWNPSVRKAAVVDVSNVANERIFGTVIGFGVCRETADTKIVKINYVYSCWIDIQSVKSVSCIPWQVEVFTLSTGDWRRPTYSTNLPRKWIHFVDRYHVVIDGMIYWLASDRNVDGGSKSYNLIISFDVTSEEFREVNLPDCLAHLRLEYLSIDKLRESLVVLEHDQDANDVVIGVWVMKDVVPQSFTKLYTIVLPDVYLDEVYVSGFRKTGEPIIDSYSRFPEWTGSLAVYEPNSKSITRLGIHGADFSYIDYSYIETLLLL